MGKAALGKGLGALIAPRPAPGTGPVTAPAPPEPALGDRVMRIPLDRIVPTPLQPRKHFREESIAELVASIRAHGVLQPLVLRKVGDAFELIAGERRWRAARAAGLAEAPAILREATDLEVLELALIENLQREDLNPIEEAQAYHRLADEFRLTQEQISEKVGKSRAAIANSMRLLDLDPQVRAYVERGTLSVGHAKVLLSLKNPAEQLMLADLVIRQSATVRATERILAEHLARSSPNGSGGKRQRPAKLRPPLIQNLENRLREHLATQVSIQHGEKKGRIEIEYYGAPDLQRLLDVFGLPADD
jgi:ParB family chromosome partitioning protein